MFLADISSEALSITKSCGVRGIPLRVEEGAPLPLDPSSVTLAYSYYVFSHISETSAIFWINDLYRILRPGGALVITAQSLRFLNLVHACKISPSPTDLERSIGTYINDPAEAIQQFHSGHHVFTGGGGHESSGLSNEDYGWAAMPRTWLESVIAGKFIIEKHDDAPRIQPLRIFTCFGNRKSNCLLSVTAGTT